MSHHARLLARAEEHNIPLDVAIELTHRCNLRCRHCYIPDFAAEDRLTSERLLTLLDELVEMGTLGLTLTGGEPLLRPDWVQIAQRARDLGFALRILTNGTLIDTSTAEAISELNAAVEITLHAMQAEVFEGITGLTGSFEKTLAGIERLRRRDVEVVLKTPIQVENRHQHEAVAAYAEKIGAGHEVFATIMPKKDGNPAPLEERVSPTSVKEVLLPAVEQGFSLNREGPLCAAATRYCVISASGDVLACHILPGSGGNLRDRTFREVWEGSPWLRKVRSIRVDDLKTCGACERLPYCGRCHAQAMLEDGDIYGPSSFAGERAEVVESLQRELRREAE